MYHGTRAGFRKGGYVIPGDELGKDNHGLGRSDAVYLTPNYDEAEEWALSSKGRGRPKVLFVRPGGPLTVDDSTVGGEEHEGYRCAAWCEVLRVQIVEPR